jgi:uncharacterized phage protein (TIGR02218 family)
VKSASTALINLINAARAAKDAQLVYAECYTFGTTIGTNYYWTNVDWPILYNGFTFLASGPLVSGPKYRASVGLEVDKQQLTIAARPTDVINGAPFLVALRDGAFDGAPVQRDRVFLSAPGPSGSVIGGVTLFKGRISTIDQVGRTQATLTLASDLVILDYDMPHNLFSATCNHILYDAGCGVIRGTYATSGSAGSGSTANQINFPGAAAMHAGGAIVFSSGQNANVRATVKSVSASSSLALMYPLPFAPALGDAFTVYAGCDHTLATCQSQFNNKRNFRGFPFVPPPEMAV